MSTELEKCLNALDGRRFVIQAETRKGGRWRTITQQLTYDDVFRRMKEYEGTDWFYYKDKAQRDWSRRIWKQFSRLKIVNTEAPDVVLLQIGL